MMRIFSGKHKGRKLLTSADDRIRPTGSRTRESVFNMLAHSHWMPEGGLQGAVVADVCCGTGAFALEALSRGAARAVLMDNSTDSLQLAQKNAAHLGELAQCRFVQADCASLPAIPERCTVVYLDPPYGQNLVIPALKSLVAKQWLAVEAVVLVEQQAREIFTPPAGFELRDERTYGNAKVSVLAYHSA